MKKNRKFIKRLNLALSQSERNKERERERTSKMTSIKNILYSKRAKSIKKPVQYIKKTKNYFVLFISKYNNTYLYLYYWRRFTSYQTFTVTHSDGKYIDTI